MEVWLYRVGRNLNRAYRTCASFGIERLVLVDCADVNGRLYSAEGRVEIVRASEMPPSRGTLVLEDYVPTLLAEVDWRETGRRIDRLLLGGETSGVPRRYVAEQSARIPTSKPSLTVEGALAIALYARSLA